MDIWKSEDLEQKRFANIMSRMFAPPCGSRERGREESLSKQSVLSVSSVAVRGPAAVEDEDGTNGK